jgi:hypothetical protein
MFMQFPNVTTYLIKNLDVLFKKKYSSHDITKINHIKKDAGEGDWNNGFIDFSFEAKKENLPKFRKEIETIFNDLNLLANTNINIGTRIVLDVYYDEPHYDHIPELYIDFFIYVNYLPTNAWRFKSKTIYSESMTIRDDAVVLIENFYSKILDQFKNSKYKLKTLESETEGELNENKKIDNGRVHE